MYAIRAVHCIQIGAINQIIFEEIRSMFLKANTTSLEDAHLVMALKKKFESKAVFANNEVTLMPLLDAILKVCTYSDDDAEYILRLS